MSIYSFIFPYLRLHLTLFWQQSLLVNTHIDSTRKMDNKGESEIVSSWPTILLIGDSLTQKGYSESGKWVALLSDLFQRKCDIINRGFSGYTTRSLKAYIPSIVTNELVSSNVATVLFLGANDSNIKELNEAQHVPLEEYKNNLSEIIGILCKKGISATTILVVPPPPCNEEMWRKALEEREGSSVKRSPKNNEMTRLYHDACVEMALKLNCRTLTDTNSYWDSLNSGENFCDGLHFSPKGSYQIFNYISKELAQMTQQLPVILPDWKELCKENNV